MEETGLSEGRLSWAQPRASGFVVPTSLNPQRGIPKRDPHPSTGAQTALLRPVPSPGFYQRHSWLPPWQIPSCAPRLTRSADLVFNHRGTESFLSPAIILSLIKIPPAIL